MPAIEAIESHKRPQREVLEELVTSVRGLNSHVRQFDPRMEHHERHFKHPALQFHPAMFDELLFLLSKAGNSSAAILAVSGYIRDDFPWLSEILNDFFRELRNSNNKNIAPNIKRLQTFLEILSEDAEVIGISRNSKYAMRMFGELPRVFDMILHHVLVDTRQNDQSLETVVDTDTNG